MASSRLMLASARHAAAFGRRRAHLLVVLLCCLALVLPLAGGAPMNIARAAPLGESPLARFAATARFVAESNVDATRNVIYPSPLYRDGTWLRDAFYITAALGDAKLSQAAWEQFASFQRDDGNVPNSYYFYPRDPDYKVDDSALFLILWAYRDAALYGIEYDRTVLNRALKFVLANIYEGRYVTPAGVSHSWVDTLRYPEADVIAHNQGLLAVTLRGAKTLQMPVRDDEIAQAERAYRALYRADLGYMPHSMRSTYRDTSVFVGEFLSQWLFNRPLLTPEIVSMTIRNFAATAGGYKNLADQKGDFLHPNNFEPPSYPGDYQNGASWFLYDFLALTVGILHEMPGARDALRWRVELEFRPGDDMREYLQTNWELPYYLNSPPHRSHYGWNAFTLVAERQLQRYAPGFAIADLSAPLTITDDDMPFLTEYRRFGGQPMLGQPLTGRFVWNGAITQVYQRGVLAGFPGARKVALVNLFDEMSRFGLDERLHQSLSTPRPLPDEAFQGTSAERRAQRLALLEPYPALKARYLAVPAGIEPESIYGLPTSAVEEREQFRAIRLQRAVLQEWKVDTSFAKAGETTVANAGDAAMQVGFFKDWLPSTSAP